MYKHALMSLFKVYFLLLMSANLGKPATLSFFLDNDKLSEGEISSLRSLLSGKPKEGGN